MNAAGLGISKISKDFFMVGKTEVRHDDPEKAACPERMSEALLRVAFERARVAANELPNRRVKGHPVLWRWPCPLGCALAMGHGFGAVKHIAQSAPS